MPLSPVDEERRKQDLLAMMDPSWYIPEWNINAGKLWSAEQITAKKRIQALYRTGRWTKVSLARLCGVHYISLVEWLRDSSYFPSLGNARKVNAAIDAHERANPVR